jgi:hypothetical protein
MEAQADALNFLAAKEAALDPSKVGMNSTANL